MDRLGLLCRHIYEHKRWTQRELAQALGLSGERYEMKTNYSTSVVDATGTHSTESLSRGSRITNVSPFLRSS